MPQREELCGLWVPAHAEWRIAPEARPQLVQGQLLITGMQWCDFVGFAEEDLLVQRIYKDAEVARVIRERAGLFLFLSLLDLIL